MKKEDSTGNEPDIQGTGGPATEEKKGKDEDGDETVEGAEDGDDAASVVTVIHSSTEHEAESEA